MEDDPDKTQMPLINGVSPQLRAFMDRGELPASLKIRKNGDFPPRSILLETAAIGAIGTANTVAAPDTQPDQVTEV